MRIIFLDTETTGLAETDRLLQISYKIRGRKACLTENFKPPVPIGFEAMATHHITESMVSDKPEFKTSGFRELLAHRLQFHVMVAHNAKFDLGMLDREEVQPKLYICTKKVAQSIFDEDSYRLQYLRYKYNLQVKGKAHDAEGDVRVLEALFEYLFEKMLQPGQDESEVIKEMINISSRPVLLRRIAFGKHKGMTFDEIPTDYIQWMLKQSDIDEDLKFTLEHHLQGRGK